jgi:hypothetical protein
MATQTAKVKNGVIKLPEELRVVWENADVYITGEKDRISIKRLSSPPFGAMMDEMNQAGKGLRKKDLNDALRTTRTP